MRFPTRKQTRLGRWSLTPNHDLALTLDERIGRSGESLTLVGKIISVDAGELVFAVRTRTEEGAEAIRLVKLSGSWRADPENRLTFAVSKGGDEEDLLTFQGAWEVGDHHEILYRYQKRDLATKEKTEEVLAFRGTWEIRENEALTYALTLSGDSRFDFRAALQSPSLIGKKNEIRYQIGIGLSGAKDFTVRKITLFGKWKLSRDLSLSFEMAYGDGARRAVLFGTTYHVNEEDEIIFALKSLEGKNLGIEVTFTRAFFKGEGKAFLQFYKDAVESRIEGGVRIPF